MPDQTSGSDHGLRHSYNNIPELVERLVDFGNGYVGTITDEEQYVLRDSLLRRSSNDPISNSLAMTIVSQLGDIVSWLQSTKFVSDQNTQ